MFSHHTSPDVPTSAPGHPVQWVGWMGQTGQGRGGQRAGQMGDR